MDDPRIIVSRLSRTVEENGTNVEICIYRLEETDWSLEVVAEDGTSTVWNEPFKSDEEALEEALRAIEEDGIDSFSAKQNEKRVLH